MSFAPGVCVWGGGGGVMQPNLVLCNLVQGIWCEQGLTSGLNLDSEHLNGAPR